MGSSIMAWKSADSINKTMAFLSFFQDSSYLIAEEVYAQEIPDFGSVQTKNIAPVLDDFFAVYDEREMQARIKAIQMKMLQEQNVGYQAGKCLRVFVEKVSSAPLSRVACRLVQWLDRNYMRVSFAFKRFSRCDEGEKSQFCKLVKQAQLLKDVERENREEIEPAQELVAHTLGFVTDELFSREELRRRNFV